MTLRKDLADPADPRDRRAARPRYTRPGEPLKPEADTAVPTGLPQPDEDEPTDEGSARPLPDPQGEGRF